MVFKLEKTINKDETKYRTFYSTSKTETVIHGSGIDNVFKSIDDTIMTKTQKYQSKGSSWIIYLVMEQNINISKCKYLSSSRCVKLLKELNHSRECLINIQNTDDKKFLKWCLVKHLHPVDRNLVKIRKTKKDFAKLRKRYCISISVQSTFQKVLLKYILIYY